MIELIKRGSDYDAQDMAGRTPLMLACSENCLEAVKLLLGIGANPNIFSFGKRVAKDYTKND